MLPPPLKVLGQYHVIAPPTGCKIINEYSLPSFAFKKVLFPYPILAVKFIICTPDVRKSITGEAFAVTIAGGPITIPLLDDTLAK